MVSCQSAVVGACSIGRPSRPTSRRCHLIITASGWGDADNHADCHSCGEDHRPEVVWRSSRQFLRNLQSQPVLSHRPPTL
nr:hypothetical protein [Bradyrhizobium japonicum]